MGLVLGKPSCPGKLKRYALVLENHLQYTHPFVDFVMIVGVKMVTCCQMQLHFYRRFAPTGFNLTDPYGSGLRETC